MSWKSIYKNVYKTSNPNLFISAVCSFPNIVDTVEKAIVDYEVKQLQKDPIHLKLQALYNIYNGRRYTPLYFEDDCSKLKNLPYINKGYFWCILYKSEYLTIKSQHSSQISRPSYEELLELLDYSHNNLKGKYNQFLFHHIINSYIYSKTEFFNEKEKSRRFQLIENSSLIGINHKTTYEEMKEYIKNMNLMNIYEFIFKAFSNNRY